MFSIADQSHRQQVKEPHMAPELLGIIALEGKGMSGLLKRVWKLWVS